MRAPWRASQAVASSRREPACAPSKHQHAAGTLLRLRITRIVDGGTQHYRVSATVNNPSDAELHAVPKRMLVLSVDIVCGVNGDHEVIDARRRSGRADVRK